MTSGEQNKALVRRFFDEVWNEQKLDVIADVFAPTVLVNGQSVARDVFKSVVANRRAAFPDLRVTVDEQVAEGDKVSTRRTWEGTHQGVYRGVAPTGKRVKWTQISIVRFADSLIAEDWAVADELSVLQQLGQIVA
jgi:predicted ester cyclase